MNITTDTTSLLESQVLELKRLIEHDINETRERLKSLTDELSHVDKMLDSYKHRIGSHYIKSVSSITPQEFEGKTLRESLRLIAERNNMVIIVKDAVKILKEAKVFGNPQNAASVIYAILNRSVKSEK